MGMPGSRGVFYSNYDYSDPNDEWAGESLYSHMNKYKSVADFLKKKRKARKKKVLYAYIEIFTKIAENLKDIQKIDFPMDAQVDLNLSGQTPSLGLFDGVSAPVNNEEILDPEMLKGLEDKEQAYITNKYQGTANFPVSNKNFKITDDPYKQD